MLPRQPSASTVMRARISGPGAKLGPGSPDRSIPTSPICTPATEPSSLKSGCAAAKPGKTSTPSASARAASNGVRSPSETMKLPSLCCCGGTGMRIRRVRVSNANSSRLAGMQMPGGASRQPGSRASSGAGSSTAPDSACAPMADAFSSTQMLSSGLFSLSLMAQARPPGPPPTTKTSYSIVSRSMSISRLRRSLRLHADAAVQADGLAVQHGDRVDGLDHLRIFIGASEA